MQGGSEPKSIRPSTMCSTPPDQLHSSCWIHLGHGGNVALAQSLPLPDLDAAGSGHDRRFPILRERVHGIVHDRRIVVGVDVVAVLDLLMEVVRGGFGDVLPSDRHLAVAVLTALLVPEADGVADFVDDVAG